MSKTSNKRRYAQLMEWLSTKPKPRKKPVEQNGQSRLLESNANSRLRYYESKNA